MKNQFSVTFGKVVILLSIAITLLAFIQAASAQSTVKAHGKELVSAKTDAATTAEKLTKNATLTEYVFRPTKNDTLYPVWKSSRGNLFIVRISSQGNAYPQYLPKDVVSGDKSTNGSNTP